MTRLIELINGRRNCANLLLWYSADLENTVQDFSVVDLRVVRVGKRLREYVETHLDGELANL